MVSRLASKSRQLYRQELSLRYGLRKSDARQLNARLKWRSGDQKIYQLTHWCSSLALKPHKPNLVRSHPKNSLLTTAFVSKRLIVQSRCLARISRTSLAGN